MKDYFAFGGRFRSEIDFPDLSPLGSDAERPDRELTVGDTEAPPVAVRPLGRYETDPEWVFRLSRIPDGFRLAVGTLGTFDIVSDGRRIVWYPGSDNPPELVRATVLGPVMALALRESGALCLHGSAVSIDGRGVAFLAPKFHGKSTMALALTSRGARLVTDDLVAVDPTLPSPNLLPGVHSVRLLEDGTERWKEEFPDVVVREGWKHTWSGLPPESLQWDPVPLDAIYLLRPVESRDDGRAASRQALPPARAAASVALSGKIPDELLGYGLAAETLGTIGTLVSEVPVYRLDVARDMDRLADVVGCLETWHTTESLFPVS